jgi:hypothetical protein
LIKIKPINIFLILVILIISSIYILHDKYDKPENQSTPAIPISSSCYLNAYNSCIPLSDIGFIEQSSINSACEHTNCTNITEYRKVIAMLVIKDNFQNKTLIPLHG